LHKKIQIIKSSFLNLLGEMAQMKERNDHQNDYILRNSPIFRRRSLSTWP
jgi:hypothetical protein